MGGLWQGCSSRLPALVCGSGKQLSIQDTPLRHFAPSPLLPAPTSHLRPLLLLLPVQLCKDFHSGKMDRHEYEVNIENGFVKRTHAPLVPVQVAV